VSLAHVPDDALVHRPAQELAAEVVRLRRAHLSNIASIDWDSVVVNAHPIGSVIASVDDVALIALLDTPAKTIALDDEADAPTIVGSKE
jgi:hypothetical protein